MGGLVAKHTTTVRVTKTIKTIHVSSHSYGDQIEVEIVFAALFKLSCLFEINESLMRSLTDEILSLRHTNFHQQFLAVEAWIKKYVSGVVLKAEEIDYLIQYVELYRPASVIEDMSQANSSRQCTRSYGESEVTETSRRSCLLVCPYRHEMAALTGDIRTQEAKKLNASWHSPMEHTFNLRFPSRSSFNTHNRKGGVDETRD
mgnify:CR=1 FL=1